MTESNEPLPQPIEAEKSMAPGATVKVDVLSFLVPRVDALAERRGGQSRFAMLNAVLLAGLMVAESVVTPTRKS